MRSPRRWSDGVFVLVLAAAFSGPSVQPLRAQQLDPIFDAPSLVTDVRGLLMARADFDGDGIPDLLSTYDGPSTAVLEAWRGTGTGFFERVATSNIPPNTAQFAAGDFTGDGVPDVAIRVRPPFPPPVPPPPERMALYEGTTGGVYTPIADLVIDGNANGPHAIAIVDLDVDGLAEIVFATPGGLRAIRNSGSNEFALDTLGSLPFANATWLKAATLSSESSPVLLLWAQRDARIAIYDIEGSGEIGPATIVAPTIGVHDVIAGDFDSDGLAELVVGDDRNYEVLARDSSGTWASLGAVPTGYFSTMVRYLTSGDYNDDGDLDLVLVHHYSSDNYHNPKGFFLAGAGDLTFAPPTRIPSGGNYGLWHVESDDLNLDGVPDVWGRGIDGNVYVLHSRGGAVPFPSGIRLDHADNNPMQSADFNRDNRVDLVLENSGYLVFGWGSPAGGIATWDSIPLPSPAITFAVADANDDALPDLVAQCGSTVVELLGDGLGAFTPTEHIPPLRGNMRAAVDMTGDGLADILSVESEYSPYQIHRLYVHRSGGQARFDTGEMVTASNSAITSIVTADFNEDGRLDIVITQSANHASLLLQQPDGSFVHQGPLYLNSASFAASTADFDRDGHADVAFVTYADIVVCLGAGDGTFTCSTSPTNVAWIWDAVHTWATDVDMDGSADLMISSASPAVGVMRNDGSGGMSPIVFYGGNEAFKGAIALEYTGDGVTDLLTYNGWEILVSPGTLANLAIQPEGLPNHEARLRIAPQPVRGFAHLTFATSVDGQVDIDLYDPSGRRIARLFDARLRAGSHSVSVGLHALTSTRLDPGVYFVRVESPGQVQTAPLVLLR